MVVLDLTIFSIQRIGGISVVWGEYLKRLRKSNKSLQYVLFYPKNKNKIADQLDLDEYDARLKTPRGVVSKYLPFLLIGRKGDILHTSYYQWYPFYRGTKIVTLHDFMHEKFGSFKSSLLHNLLKFLSLNSADVILCISESTKNDLREFYPKLFIKKDIRVIENAASDVFYPDIRSSERPCDFLWVAGRSGYKNFKYALDILGYLKRKGQIFNLSVVGPKLTVEEMDYAALKGVSDQIEVFSNVSMAELRVMYSNALAFLYLSKYEGFGLPILEAQKCLCPVVALKNPASMEVGKKSILYLNCGNEADIVNIIDKISDDKTRDKIVRNGLENSKRYDWNVSVKKLTDVYLEYQIK